MPTWALGVIVGSNLTRGKGGVGSKFPISTACAIRHGVVGRHPLVAMPSKCSPQSDGDPASVIAFLKNAPPSIASCRPRIWIRGRALLAAGKLNILVAPRDPSRAEQPLHPPAPRSNGPYRNDQVVRLPRYRIVRRTRRRSASLPPASNLTPTGWALSQPISSRFAKASGRMARCSTNSCRGSFAKMTDNEIIAIWLYLKSVPPSRWKQETSNGSHQVRRTPQWHFSYSRR